MAKPKKALREYREANNLTCAEAGAKIDVAESTWRSYENGTREVDAELAIRIEREIGIRRQDLRGDLFGEHATA